MILGFESLRNIFASDALLSQAQLKRLSEHKYNVQNNSIMEYYLQSFWNFLTSRLPLWLAPNLITVLGLVVNLIAVIILLVYDCEPKHEVPRWPFFLSAFTIFFYQTLDGLDGKQARRTNTASPLGELFDHGCDAFSQVLVGLQVCMALRLEIHPNLFLAVCLLGEILFYCAHWQAYVSGKLTLNKFDCIEALCCAIILCIITGCFGPDIWLTRIGSIGVQLNIIAIVLSALPAGYCLYQYFEIIFSDGAGKNGSSVAGTGILSPFSPLLLVVVPQIMIYSHRLSSTFFADQIGLYCFTFGCISAKITIKLVVAHLSRSPLAVWDSTFYGPLFIFINQYYDQIIPNYWSLIVCLVCGIFSF